MGLFYYPPAPSAKSVLVFISSQAASLSGAGFNALSLSCTGLSASKTYRISAWLSTNWRENSIGTPVSSMSIGGTLVDNVRQYMNNANQDYALTLSGSREVSGATSYDVTFSNTAGGGSTTYNNQNSTFTVFALVVEV